VDAAEGAPSGALAWAQAAADTPARDYIGGRFDIDHPWPAAGASWPAAWELASKVNDLSSADNQSKVRCPYISAERVESNGVVIAQRRRPVIGVREWLT